MSFLLGLLLLPFVAVWVLPLVSDALSALKALFRIGRRPPPVGEADGQRLLVLVPAHNEASQIDPCVRSIVGAHGTDGVVRVIVVADNCTDDTAELARQAGAEAWERSDPSRPGKPPAIQWALDQIDLDDYDALVIIDADTVVMPDYMQNLVATGPLRDRVVQTYYGIQDVADSWVNMLAGLLVASKYEGQYQLRGRAGLNAPMTGNGMVIGREVLARCGWADDALTENWEMYTRYTVAGERIDLVTASRLEALEPTTMGESTVRRQRWQAGKWGVLRDYSGALVRPGRFGVHQRIDLLAELLSPGPVAHAGIGVVLGALLVVFGTTPLLVGEGVALIASPLPTIIWAIHAFLHHPHQGRVAMAMMRLPFYLAWRVTIIARALPTYLSGVWQRSPRPGDS